MAQDSPLPIPDYEGPDLRLLIEDTPINTSQHPPTQTLHRSPFGRADEGPNLQRLIESLPNSSDFPATQSLGRPPSSRSIGGSSSYASTAVASPSEKAEFLRSVRLWSRDPMPEIWCRLPNEILCTIIEHSDRQTRIAWSCTNAFFYNFSSNLLWKSLHITPKNLEGVYNDWLDPNPFNLCEPDSDRERMLAPFLGYANNPLYFEFRKLAHPGIQDSAPKLPAQRVKFLNVDFLGLRFQQNREVMHRAFHGSLWQMDQLQRCHYEGRVFPRILEILLEKKDTLRELVLRWRSEYLQFSEGYPTGQTLDFRILSGLSQLQTLKIGRLSPYETWEFAQAVVTLRLEVLEVSSAPPADNNDTRRNLVGTVNLESPLLRFLGFVNQLKPRTKTHAGSWEGGLPSTLKNLTLRDLYRPAKTKKQRVILDAIANCKMLEQLELRTMATLQLKLFFRFAELPSLKHLHVSGCRHFLPDKAWVALGLRPDCFAAQDPSVYGTMETFPRFLHRHRYQIIDLQVTRPAMSIEKSNRDSLHFGKWDLHRCWKICDQNMDLNVPNLPFFQRGEFGFSCNNEGYCYVRNIPRPVTMRRLEGFTR